MPAKKKPGQVRIHLFIPGLIFILTLSSISCNSDRHTQVKRLASSGSHDSTSMIRITDELLSETILMVLPKNPGPGTPFRILAAGGEDIRRAQILVNGPAGKVESPDSKSGEKMSGWQIKDFTGAPAGKYKATLIINRNVISELEFNISMQEVTSVTGKVWKTLRGWDKRMELLYSVWINALFTGCDEHDSWSALHEVTQNPDRNFLYNYLSLGEDDPKAKKLLILQPDCADNPFFLRAYFSWKLGLPFGYHVCDRGSLVKKPGTGQWITNETISTKTDPADALNTFLRKLKDGVHSGTARTALDNENSDYYPVSLEHGALNPGTVFADPYGHTLIITSYLPQTGNKSGLLLSVDAQPDGTVGIKRFWKGNFLFNTSGVVGEPGFKAFRPILLEESKPRLIQNRELTEEAGFIPYSLKQRKMEPGDFYHAMERLINPKPLDPETELQELLQALHEQLIVRVTSVANGEAYFKSHPGTVIPMPSNAAGIFLAGGQWENFSTPNRDLRLLIAMDEVLNCPYINKLQSLFNQRSSELQITYIRSDGSLQKLTVGEILKRRDAFEMAYNPNDGIEIRWGAPENSDERARCNRQAPANQLEKMRSVRTWFSKRLHPPT